jgi:hypothetical protein
MDFRIDELNQGLSLVTVFTGMYFFASSIYLLENYVSPPLWWGFFINVNDMLDNEGKSNPKSYWSLVKKLMGKSTSSPIPPLQNG